MRKKADCHVHRNKLDLLLNVRLNTKKTLSTDLTAITDFPKLKKKQLIAGIFLGTFQLRLCKSYISDVVNNNECFVIDKDISRQIKNGTKKQKISGSINSKIIGIEISSRHKRGELKKKKQKMKKQK